MSEFAREWLRCDAGCLRSERRVIEIAASGGLVGDTWFAAAVRHALRYGATVDECIVEGLAGWREKH